MCNKAAEQRREMFDHERNIASSFSKIVAFYWIYGKVTCLLMCVSLVGSLLILQKKVLKKRILWFLLTAHSSVFLTKSNWVRIIAHLQINLRPRRSDRSGDPSIRLRFDPQLCLFISTCPWARNKTANGSCRSCQQFVNVWVLVLIGRWHSSPGRSQWGH